MYPSEEMWTSMPMAVTTIKRQAGNGPTKKPMSAWKPVAGIQSHSLMPAPAASKPRVWLRAPKATSIATSHEATTAQTATLCDCFPISRPSSPVMAKPASGSSGMGGIKKVIALVPHAVVLVHEGCLLVAEDGDDDRQAYRRLGRRAGDDEQGDDRGVDPQRSHERTERENGQVDGVDHQLDGHQHADRVAPGQEAEGADGEQEAREHEVGVERVAHDRSSSRGPLSRRAREPPPTTAAASSTLTTSNGRT